MSGPITARRLPRRAYAGAIGLVLCEALLFSGSGFVGQFFTPLVWTFYIFLVDGILERVSGSSPMTRVPTHVAWSAAASIGIWYLFEAYDVRMEGWRYVGLPESYPLRVFGYFWAFATIGPGMFVTRELVQHLLARRRSRRAEPATPPAAPAATDVPRPVLLASVAVGIACCVSPFLVSQETSRYLWAPVWAGFIFLVDPINAWLGRGSIWRDAFRRDGRRLASLLLAGLVCGGLWEFWNFWADGKWLYTFPFAGIEHLKLFEMPIVGFVGFPPFAVEYYAMTELLSRLWGGDADFGAPGFRKER